MLKVSSNTSPAGATQHRQSGRLVQAMANRWFLGFSLLRFTSLAAATDFLFDPNVHTCGICLDIEAGESCKRFGACAVVNASVVRAADGCNGFCQDLDLGINTQVNGSLELRVAKGFGTKGYDQMRISVISQSAEPPISDFFDYSAQFQYRWTNNFLHTAMKSVQPGRGASYKIGEQHVNVSLPLQGASTSGLLIADPCNGQGLMRGACFFADRFKLATRLPELINAFVPGTGGTDFWGIFGDNFYDRDGHVTAGAYSKISLEAKSKIFVTVPGNHDYWVFGSPSAGSSQDQCGNGHMQYYAQDAKAAENISASNSQAPFDFSVNPAAAHGCNIAAMHNFFWYNQIGNIGLVGQSGAYSLDEARPFMVEACSWLSEQSGVEVAMLFGHWDAAGLGATPEMTMPQWYDEMAELPGCKEFYTQNKLKFVMGHTHCNEPHPHGKVGAGFRVAGFGMEGCGNFGVPIVDTSEGRIRFWYFDTSDDQKYQAVLDCVNALAWRSCKHLATLWLDQSLGEDQELVV